MSDQDLEIQKLKEQIKEWRDAWYVQREATGKAYWDGARYGYAQGLAIVNKLTVILSDKDMSDITTLDEKICLAGMPGYFSSSGHQNKSPYGIGD